MVLNTGKFLRKTFSSLLETGTGVHFSSRTMTLSILLRQHWFKGKRLNALVCSSQSPDLCSIESQWYDLKIAVHQTSIHQRNSANSTRSSRSTLKMARCAKRIETSPERHAAVIVMYDQVFCFYLFLLFFLACFTKCFCIFKVVDMFCKSNEFQVVRQQEIGQMSMGMKPFARHCMRE